MKKNRLRCTLFLTFLTILMLLTMSVSAQAAGVKTPGKVTVTRVRLTGSNNVTVYWKKAKNATNYRIYYKQAGAKSWKGIATVGAGRTSYTHNSSNKNPLIGGSKYVYTVRAYNRSSKKWGSYNKKGIAINIPVAPTPTTVPTPTPLTDMVTAQGVTFDMKYFPKTVTVGDDMECLCVIPKSTINPTDITYKIADGTAQQLCSPETPNLHLSYGTEYMSNYYVSDWKHMIAYIKTSYEPGMYLEHRVEIYNQLQTGTFPVSVYYKNTLLRTCQVSVISIDEDAVKERQWTNEIEQNAWTNDMSVMEKLVAIKKYVYDNYTYTTDGIMCNAGAQALLFAARDLGLTARYRFVGPQYDYEKGYGDVYYHFGSAFCGGHVCTIITIEGKEYIMETQGHEG